MKSIENNVFNKENSEMCDTVFEENQDETDICSKSNIEIKNNISTIQNTNVTDCIDDDYDMGI